MLINLSNHPQAKWGESQQLAANLQFGIIADLVFPSIDPHSNSAEIEQIALEYFNKITNMLDLCGNEPKANAVHIQGEFTFVFNLVNLLKSSGIMCVASTSKRKVQELDGRKVVEFNFVQFREYK